MRRIYQAYSTKDREFIAAEGIKPKDNLIHFYDNWTVKNSGKSEFLIGEYVLQNYSKEFLDMLCRCLRFDS